MNTKRLTYDEVFKILFNDVNKIMNNLYFGNDTINSIITESLIELEIKNKTTFTNEIINCILTNSEADIRSWYQHFKGFLMQGQYEMLQRELIFDTMKNTLLDRLETSYNNC